MSATWIKTDANTWTATVNGKPCKVERWVTRHSRCRKSSYGIGSYRDYYSTTYAKPAVFDAAADKWVYLESVTGVAAAKAAAAKYATTGEGAINTFWTDTSEKWRREAAAEAANESAAPTDVV